MSAVHLCRCRFPVCVPGHLCIVCARIYHDAHSLSGSLAGAGNREPQQPHICWAGKGGTPSGPPNSADSNGILVDICELNLFFFLKNKHFALKPENVSFRHKYALANACHIETNCPCP